MMKKHQAASILLGSGGLQEKKVNKKLILKGNFFKGQFLFGWFWYPTSKPSLNL